MKLNENKFYELANENGFESADISSVKSTSLSLSVFHGEIDSFTSNETFLLTARGIIKGKLGSVTTEAINKNTPEYLIDSIKRTAKVIENDDPVLMFKGSEKYQKKSIFNKNVINGDIPEKIGILLKIEEKLKEFDIKINEVVSVGYEEESSEIKLSNSYGLKLSQKSSAYTYFAEVSAKNGEEIRTGYKVFVSNNPDEFDVDKFVKEVANDALEKLGSVQCESKKYPVILNPKTSATLLSFLINSLDAEEIQKHTSLLEGKLGQKVLSNKLTITEDPLKKTLFFRYFDDEGVATYKKDLIKNGVISTYLYTLQTAKKDGVEPTGNGFIIGSKAKADVSYTVVKPGKKSEEEMFAEIEDGIYITDLAGLHSGMNANSGNFSLQAEGFRIRNGKKAEPLALITVAGNLIDIFNDIKMMGNNSELILHNQMLCPSIFIKKMSISGK